MGAAVVDDIGYYIARPSKIANDEELDKFIDWLRNAILSGAVETRQDDIHGESAVQTAIKQNNLS